MFQPNEGLKFSNPLEYRAFVPRFIDAGLSRGAPSSRGRIHDPANIIFPGKLSWPLKEERIRLDGTLDITDRRSRGHCSLAFFFRGLYQDYLQGGFLFSIWHKYQLGFRREQMWQQHHASRHRIPEKKHIGFTLYSVRWMVSLDGTGNHNHSKMIQGKCLYLYKISAWPLQPL